ncbi:MAG: NADH:flavin oxidoreductase [Desulfomonilaceae bacterium]
MSKLFERTVINGMELSNRFVRSATWEAMAAEDGSVTPKLIETLVNLAKGGAGLIITSHSYVLPEGQARPRQMGIYKDELVDKLEELTAAVHQAGARIAMQISHAGNATSEALIGRHPFVVSNFEGLSDSPRVEITTDYIRLLISAFADAARRAKASGFDAVQIHSAHGYLLSQFLSPAFNRRQDEYGGSIENRSRIHLEIYRAIRKVVGPEFPIMIKLNCEDFVEDGLKFGESLQVGRMLADAGLDAIELSGGLPISGKLSYSRVGIRSEKHEAYFQEYAQAFKKQMAIPIILVGGIRSFSVAERLLEDGMADYISMSRPFIREPALINRWKAGDHRRALCISDNLCYGPVLQGEGIYCVTEEKEKGKY